MIERNSCCWCGSGKKWKKCHYPTLPKESTPGSSSLSPDISLEELTSYYRKNYDIILKNEKQIAGIAAACTLAATILDRLCQEAQEGVTTEDLHLLALKLHQEAGAIPAPLGYGNPPFPKSICTSLNEVICHGIPDLRPLQKGDILNIDVTSILQGYYGDCSRMVVIGETSEEKKRVIRAAFDSLYAAIGILKPGIAIGQIGETIEHIAKRYGCSVVESFVSHGVGVEFHEGPEIPHYANSLDIPLIPGMTFTIEPMINAGKKGCLIDPEDHWTARTEDGRASAQFEHTVLITETGHKILTALPEAFPCPV